MKKRIHLVSNAHLDPVWLWRWQEGCGEALSTFRTAADLIDEYNNFKFNHNEVIVYQWVKDNDPELFAKMQKLAKEGKWNIIGGWYLQPDCNMPSGESFVRNIMAGRIFFNENFNQRPTTAINFDSFGHSKGLVQILKQSGYDSYLVCRPSKENFDFESQDYLWKGIDGSSVVVHRSDENYNSVWGEVSKELTDFIKEKSQEEVTMFLWGVGDHGGGPSRKDLKDITKLIEQEQDYEIIHSTPEEYFHELSKFNKELPIVDRGLNPLFQGCYSSQIRVKQKHRLLENEIYTLEKMATAAEIQCNRPYPSTKIKEAIEDLLSSEFHDALPGSGSQPVEEDTLRLLEHGLEITSREKMYSFLALSQGEAKVIYGTSTIMFYNPHPYDITDVFECEVGLPKQNWTTDFMYPSVKFNGIDIQTQAEKEESNFCLDWRKKVVVQATLKASSMNRMDVYFNPIKERPKYEPIVSAKNTEYLFDNGKMQISINTKTGLVDKYIVNNVAYLGKESFKLAMFDDCYNAWSIGSNSSNCQRNFQLLTPHEGSEFSGIANRVIESVRVIEDGDVRTVVEAVFGVHNSKAYIRYKMPKYDDKFEVEVGVYNFEKEQTIKLVLETTATCDAEYIGQVPFGRDSLMSNGDEVVSQKWVAVNDTKNNTCLAVINDGTYGSNYSDGTVGITLLRSAGYTASDFVMGNAYSEDRFAPRMEQGERIYHFKICAGECEAMSSEIDSLALNFNEKPYAVAYCPSGKGEKPQKFIEVDNKAVIISAIKKAELTDDYIIRIYEATGNQNSATIKIPTLNITQKVTLKPFEIATYSFKKDSDKFTETTIIENN